MRFWECPPPIGDQPNLEQDECRYGRCSDLDPDGIGHANSKQYYVLEVILLASVGDEPLPPSHVVNEDRAKPLF